MMNNEKDSNVEEDSINPDDSLKALHEASSEGSVKEVSRLIKQGVDPEEPNEFGETSLMHAVISGEFSVVKYLVEVVKVDVNTHFEHKDSKGWTALMYAGYYGFPEIVSYLIEHGADPKIKNIEQKTVTEIEPCIRATKEDIEEAVQKGLSSKGDEKKDEKKNETEGEIKEKSKALKSSVLVSDVKKVDDEKKIIDPLVMGLDNSPKTIGDPLTQLKSIQKIFQEYKSACADMGKETCESILKVIEMMADGKSELTLLDLNGKSFNFLLQKPYRLSDDDIMPLFEILITYADSCPILCLDLSYNSIGDRGAQIISQFLSKSPFLSELNIEGNDFGKLGGKNIAEAVGVNKSLKKLNIRNNSIGNESMCLFAKALRNNETLKHLDCGFTHCETQAMVEFAETLKTNISLLTFNIDNPKLFSVQEETTIMFSKALGQNYTIEGISMAGNKIGDHGCMWISKYLLENEACSIRELNLKANDIGASGFEYLSKYLISSQCKIEKIYLQGNPITDQALPALQELLEKNVTLKVIDLSNAMLTDIGLAAIAVSLAKNKTLENIHLTGNSFGDLSKSEFNCLIEKKATGLKFQELDFIPLIK